MPCLIISVFTIREDYLTSKETRTRTHSGISVNFNPETNIVLFQVDNIEQAESIKNFFESSESK
ncbi:MAG TPA: hypothetical protein DCL21_00890, partial [Alphaproteobacteria bacterium]|nr:hypothetical protein [Alphaproteobacteria bacterium]